MTSDPGFVYRHTCPLCQHDQYQMVFSQTFTDPPIWDFILSFYQGRADRAVIEQAAYELAQCRRCGFIWQTAILNDAGMGLLYDVWISTEDSFKKTQGKLPAAYARQIRFIQQFFPGQSPEQIRVLDFGMGWGRWCLAAKSAGFQTTGFEISTERATYAEQNGLRVLQSTEDLLKEQFDFINADQVLEHVPNPREVFEVLADRLMPGGVIRVAVPDGKDIPRTLAKTGWRPDLMAIRPLEHINCFTRQTLIQAGQSAGLTVVRPPLIIKREDGWKGTIRNIAFTLYRWFFGMAVYFRKAV